MGSPTWRLLRRASRDAVIRGESVAIFGDYDVDGATAAALAGALSAPLRARSDRAYSGPDFRRLRAECGRHPLVRRARRQALGHRRLRDNQQCNARRSQEARPRRRGRSTIIRPTRNCRRRVAIVNPNRADDLSGLGHLAAVGLVFLTLVAVTRELRQRNFWTGMRSEPDLLSLLHLVALGTVADVVPLKGLNRAFVAKGLIALRRRDQIGLTALMDASRLSGPPEPWHLGFLLGPRINAGGRIGRADLGVRLLLEEDPSEAARIAAELDRLNRERQQIEIATVAQAEAEAMAALGLEEKGAVVVTAAEGWHPGVVGLVAARLKERYGRPAFAIALEPGGIGTGSGRSIRRRRSRPGGAARRARRPAAQGRRSRHGGRHHAQERRAGRVPRLSGGHAGRRGGGGAARQRAHDRRRGQRRRRQSGAGGHAGARGALRRRQSGAAAGAAGAHAWPTPIRSARTTSARASNPATAKS